MTNLATRHLQDAVWAEAFDLYEVDCGGRLWEAPKQVQENYKERARKALREYLASFGICRYPDCDGGPATGYCHVDCRAAREPKP